MQKTQQTQEKQTHELKPPLKQGEWTLSQTQAALSRKLPEHILKTKSLGGQRIPYLPWYRANQILDKYCPGWCWNIVNIYTTDTDLFLVGRLTIPTSDGVVYREATGNEKLNCSSYGDPSSNAESQAFRRAAAKFGLGLYLYEKEKRYQLKI
jgi:hypothetical protein